MLALVSSSAPSSFQHRWGLRCRKSAPAQLRARFVTPDRRRRIFLVRADAGTASGGGNEERESSSSSDSSSTDSFSGWFGEDYDGDSSQGKKGFGGVVGAGLAGIFLATGVTFASLALSSKRTSGVKQQMEPLTSQQEVLLSSDAQNEKVDMIEGKSNEAMLEEGCDNGNQGPKSGTKDDCISYLKTTESASENKDDNASLAQQTEFADAGVDASRHEDLQADTNAYLHFAHSDSNHSSNELPIDDSSDASNLKGLNSNIASGETDSFVGQYENMGTTSLADLSSGIDSTDLNTHHQEENFLSAEMEKSRGSGEANIQLLSEPLASGSSLGLEPNATVDTHSYSEDELESVDSNEHDIDRGQKVQSLNEVTTTLQVEQNIIENVPSETTPVSVTSEGEELVVLEETVSSSLEGSPLNDAGLPEASSIPVLVNPYINEPDSDQYVEINRSQLPSESLLPTNSFSNAGIPAPSVVSSALQVPFGKVLVPAVVDQVQGQALAALQVLKVIEGDVQPCDICTRREYVRWLVSASSALSRNTTSKVYPAMYIENVTELAFDDVTPEDPDFSSIQGLAEAGLISSKLSCSDTDGFQGEEQGPLFFSPESPLSRQDLVSWKMALEKRQLPEVDKKIFHQRSGYIDVDKINPDAWPAIIADLSSGENGIISLAFGYTRLFQPEKPVTKAQAAVALSTGDAAEVVGEELARIEAESLAETVVAAHTALVAEVEKDLNASFEKELAAEREKIDAIQKLAEEARLELEKLRWEREEENNSLLRGRAAIESEMEVLSRLRNEVEEQLEGLMSNKMEIAFERDRFNKLRKEAESENQVIIQLQYELEVERKALAMARAWAEDEAKRAREQAKALEEARERWERCGIKVIVDEDLRDTASDGVTFLNAAKQSPIEEAAGRAENLVERCKSRSHIFIEEFKARAESLVENLKALAADVKGKSAAVIEKIIQKIVAMVSALKQWASEASAKVAECQGILISKASKSMQVFKDGASGFGLNVKDSARRAVEDCKESMEKITQRFKT